MLFLQVFLFSVRVIVTIHLCVFGVIVTLFLLFACFDFSESNMSENSLQNVSQSNLVSFGRVEYHF